MGNGATARAAGDLVHCFYSGPSGASAVAVNLACRLAGRLPQTAVLYGVPDPRPTYLRVLEEHSVAWEYVAKRPGPRPDAYLSAARRLAARAGTHGLVVFHGLRLFPVLGALRSLRPWGAVIGYVHGPTEELRGPGAWRAVGTALAADHLVCVTEELRALLARLPLCGRAARAAVVVPNGVDLDVWRPDPGRLPPARDALRLCFAGVLTDRKRADLALDALVTLRARGMAARLDVCGDGPERPQLEGRARAGAGPDAVVFRGLLPPEELRRAVAASHVLLHPSRSEGLSMAVLEALACGCPVVVCDGPPVPAVPTSFPRGSGVIAARAASPEALADAVEALVADPAAWVREAEQARATVLKGYTADGQAESFLARLREWWPGMALERTII